MKQPLKSILKTPFLLIDRSKRQIMNWEKLEMMESKQNQSRDTDPTYPTKRDGFRKQLTNFWSGPSQTTRLRIKDNKDKVKPVNHGDFYCSMCWFQFKNEDKVIPADNCEHLKCKDCASLRITMNNYCPLCKAVKWDGAYDETCPQYSRATSSKLKQVKFKIGIQPEMLLRNEEDTGFLARIAGNTETIAINADKPIKHTSSEVSQDNSSDETEFCYIPSNLSDVGENDVSRAEDERELEGEMESSEIWVENEENEIYNRMGTPVRNITRPLVPHVNQRQKNDEISYQKHATKRKPKIYRKSDRPKRQRTGIIANTLDCNECRLSFTFQCHYNDHMKEQHDVVVKKSTHSCKFCNKEECYSGDEDNLTEEPISANIQGPKGVFCCPNCRFSFPYRNISDLKIKWAFRKTFNSIANETEPESRETNLSNSANETEKCKTSSQILRAGQKITTETGGPNTELETGESEVENDKLQRSPFTQSIEEQTYDVEDQQTEMENQSLGTRCYQIEKVWNEP